MASMQALIWALIVTVMDQATSGPAQGVDERPGPEPGVGPDDERADGPGPAHPGDELFDESLVAALRRPLAQPGMEDLTGLGPHGHQRVVAEDVGVAIGGALLNLPWTSQMVESRSITIGSAPGPAPSAQARRIVSAITASSWRMCPKVKARKNVPSVDGAMTRNGRTFCVAPARQAIDVVDVGRSGQDRRHQGEHLSPRTCPADPTTEAHHLVHQRLEPQADHERGRHDEPSVGDERRVVEGHRRRVRSCAMMSSQEVPPWCWEHVASRTTIFPSREALSADARPSDHSVQSVDRGLGQR